MVKRHGSSGHPDHCGLVTGDKGHQFAMAHILVEPATHMLEKEQKSVVEVTAGEQK